jgi:hypothetical protein
MIRNMDASLSTTAMTLSALCESAAMCDVFSTSIPNGRTCWYSIFPALDYAVNVSRCS